MLNNSTITNFPILTSSSPSLPLLSYLEAAKMCRGVEQGRPGGVTCRSTDSAEADSFEATAGSVSCELCSSRASLYCHADDAFLCRKCDRWVHGANFLALRHIRCLLCNTCQNLTQRYVMGASAEVVLPT